MSNASASSASQGASARDGVDVGDKQTSTVVGDTCTWYARGDCYNSRSCYDCLNTLLSGDTCGIDLTSGGCASLSTLRTTANGALYSSQNFTYCGADDTACNDCTTNWLNAYLHTNNPPASDAKCVGADGCICLAACTRPTRESLIVDEFCPLFGTQTTRILAFGAVGIGVCLSFALLAMLTRWALNRFTPDSLTLPSESVQRERQRQTRRLRRREPSGPQLSLSGWKAMREQLIHSEHTSLSLPGVKEGERANGEGDDNSDDSDSSGSDHEEEYPDSRLALNATVVTVEQGDVYRPLSPSQLHAALRTDL